MLRLDPLFVQLCDTCYEHFDLASDLMKHRFAFHNNAIKPTLGNSKKISMTFIDDTTIPEVKEYEPIVEAQILNETDEVHDMIDHETSADMDIVDQIRYYTISQENIKIKTSEINECKECNKTFSKKSLLVNHMVAIHNKNSNFKCSECGKSFGINSKLIRHIKSVHQGEKNFGCNNCDKAFFQKDHLLRHERLCINENDAPIEKIQCKECNKKFSKKCLLVNHMVAIHNQNSKYKCIECGKSFGMNSLLIRHMKCVHQGEKNYGCDNCDKAFFQKDHLLRHEKLCINENDEQMKKSIEKPKVLGAQNPMKLEMLTQSNMEIDDQNNPHTEENIKTKTLQNNCKVENVQGVRKFKCKKCDKCFSNNQNLKQHSRRKVNCAENIVKYACKDCDKAFEFQSSLRNHMTEVHGKSLQIPCPECDKKFLGNKGMKNHYEKVHQEVTEYYECDICHKSFADKSSLITHSKTVKCAENMIKFKCDYCNQSFPFLKVLRNHMKQIHGKCLQFSCPECDQKFVRKERLNDHVRLIHKKDETDICGQCKKSFSNKDSLKIHIQSVHEGEKFKCEICEATYSEQRSLIYHRKKIHNQIVKSS